MNDAQVDALVEAAEEGVETDGLRVSHDETGYRFETPGTTRRGLTEPELRRAVEESPWLVSNWYYWAHVVDGPGSARCRFLRWIEGADDHDVPERYEALSTGVTREWGQLSITATLGEDGVRRYDLRHEADRGIDEEELETYVDPLDARRIATYDDEGRYRPLSTAPTLRTGWVYPDLEGGALVEAVGFLYPATVENWHRERRGELDITHFRETAKRQTGIYSIVDQLRVEELEAAAEACCVDSQCLKRRMWDEDEETPLDVPRGEEAFPCREPCSLLVTAARKFVTLGREETRTYEFDLTPTEKEQVEAIIAAVADGRVGEIREADLNDGANRYRARYLRALRGGEHGLSNTPTYPEDHD
jgi:hypothetical protein